jgi:hypothetical protein
MAFTTLMMFQLFNVFMRAPTRGAHLKGFSRIIGYGQPSHYRLPFAQL